MNNPSVHSRLSLLVFTFLYSCFSYFAQDGQLVTIKGYAPSFVGREITVLEIVDYLSDYESKLASATVQKDSSFSLSFFLKETQKLVVRCENNKSWLYAQPGAQYKVYFPEKDPYSPKLKSENTVELAFFDLPENDINYKILAFQRWNDEYMSRYYVLKSVDQKQFANKLDTFKIYVERAYKNDTSVFFLTYVRFTMAELDEIEFAGARNRYEKYDFYIKPSPVFYRNDAYMSYIKKHYQNMIPRLSNETNTLVYKGVLKSSPTMVMKALGTEYSLSNLRIRELILMNALAEQFYSDDFPQTNIMTILDSLQERALFVEHRQIAKNLKDRLTELVPGAKAPDFILRDQEGNLMTKSDFTSKYLYFHFYDPTSKQNELEMKLLMDLYQKYNGYVQFVTLYQEPPSNGNTTSDYKLKTPWKNFSISDNKNVMDQFKIRSFPSYALIDTQGYIVAAPALGPTPNAQYETIDKTFFYIQKVQDEINNR